MKLELGGKAPAVVAPDFPITTATERIVWAKCLNAGQVCVNVDYLFLPEDKIDVFVANARRLVAARYRDLNSSDYTSIINQRAYDRLNAMFRNAGETAPISCETAWTYPTLAFVKARTRLAGRHGERLTRCGVTATPGYAIG